MERGEQMARLARAFPRHQVTTGTFDLYLVELADVPTPLLAAAITAIIRTEEWFPTVAAIRLRAAELALALPTESDALSQALTRAAQSRMGDISAAAVHPLVTEAVTAVGGYYAFRTTSEPERLHARFGRVYSQLRADALRESTLFLQLPPPDPAG